MTTTEEKERTKVWVDGCFDLFHYGHANAIRQSRAMADYLVAGCHSDAAIAENKGPPVVSQEERVRMLQGCRWVDEVVRDAPYTTEIEFIAGHGVSFVAHGDDVTTDAAGLDSYRLVKAAGMYRQFPRTPGVSTTDALARILALAARPPALLAPDPAFDLALNPTVLQAFLASAAPHNRPPALQSLVSSPDQPPSSVPLPSHRPNGHSLALVRPLSRPTLYLHGSFDLFSSTDLEEFQKLSQDGQVNLLVGIWGGDDTHQKLGQKCIWSFQERALAVLQCRYVIGIVTPAIGPSSLGLPAGAGGGEPTARGVIEEVEGAMFCKSSAAATIAKILGSKEAFEARQDRKLAKSVVEKQLQHA